MTNEAGAAGHTQPPLSGGMALYVHIPFCESKCPYCDFNTYAGIESLMPPYVAALRGYRKWGATHGQRSRASSSVAARRPTSQPLTSNV